MITPREVCGPAEDLEPPSDTTRRAFSHLGQRAGAKVRVIGIKGLGLAVKPERSALKAGKGTSSPRHGIELRVERLETASPQFRYTLSRTPDGSQPQFSGTVLSRRAARLARRQHPPGLGCDSRRD